MLDYEILCKQCRACARRGLDPNLDEFAGWGESHCVSCEIILPCRWSVRVPSQYGKGYVRSFTSGNSVCVCIYKPRHLFLFFV